MLRKLSILSLLLLFLGSSLLAYSNNVAVPRAVAQESEEPCEGDGDGGGGGGGGEQEIFIHGKVFINNGARASQSQFRDLRVGAIITNSSRDDYSDRFHVYGHGTGGGDDDYRLNITADPGSVIYIYANLQDYNQLTYRTAAFTSVVNNGSSVTQDLHLATYENNFQTGKHDAFPLFFYSENPSGDGETIDIYQGETRVTGVTLTNGVGSILLGPAPPGQYRAEARHSRLGGQFRPGIVPLSEWERGISSNPGFLIPLTFDPPPGTTARQATIAGAGSSCPATGTLEGTVISDTTKQPLKDAIISRRTSNDTWVELTKTDDNGRYQTKDLRLNEKITITAAKGDYFKEDKKITLIKGKNTLDFSLKDLVLTTTFRSISTSSGTDAELTGLPVAMYEIKGEGISSKVASITTKGTVTITKGIFQRKAARKFKVSGNPNKKLNGRYKVLKPDGGIIRTADYSFYPEEAKTTKDIFVEKDGSDHQHFEVYVNDQFEEPVIDSKVKITYSDGKTLEKTLTNDSVKFSRAFDDPDITYTIQVVPPTGQDISPPSQGSGPWPIENGSIEVTFDFERKCLKRTDLGSTPVVFCGGESLRIARQSSIPANPRESIISIEQKIDRFRSEEIDTRDSVCFLLIEDKSADSTYMSYHRKNVLDSNRKSYCNPVNLGYIFVPLESIEDFYNPADKNYFESSTWHELGHALDHKRGHGYGTDANLASELSDSYKSRFKKVTADRRKALLNRVWGTNDYKPEILAGHDIYWRTEAEGFAVRYEIYRMAESKFSSKLGRLAGNTDSVNLNLCFKAIRQDIGC